MNAVLLDSGVIVALLDRSERYHSAWPAAVESIDAPLVTCGGVVTEACYLLRDPKGAADAVLANVDHHTFRCDFALTNATKSVRSLMKRYGSVPMDFADACLVAMAEELDTGRILTLDRDFEVYRWKRSRRFDLLIDLD